MKSLLATLIAASVLATPLYGFAQESNAPLTRAEVRTDLIRFEQGGYAPSVGEDASYPTDVQRAAAKIATSVERHTADAVGGATPNSSSGFHAASAMNRLCVGPVSYCNLFFGS